MLSHVIVPLDGSSLAETAVDCAKNVVDARGTITLLSVLNFPEIPVYDFYPTPSSAVAQEYELAIQESLPRAKRYLAQVADDLRANTELCVQLEVRSGEPASVIVEVAVTVKADAIVISTHGRSGLGRWLFGSVTNKVLSIAPCPVMVVPNRQKRQTAELKPPSQSLFRG